MLLDAPTLAIAMNAPDVAFGNAYPGVYIDSLIADVHAQIAAYLQFDPVLQVVTGEEGTVEQDSSGLYRGLYRLQLRHAPLVPGLASTVFSRLALTYARATLMTVPVDLTYATVQHRTATVELSPGALNFMAGVSLELDSPFGQLVATGYDADYVAGYATGCDDPVPAGGGSYGAAPMPGAITQAAVLLCRERIIQDDQANANADLATAGDLVVMKTFDQELRYGPSRTGPGTLGYGTALSAAAATRLTPYRRRSIA